MAIKKAMILSAGVGSRLEPLTLSIPKPLVPLVNIPVMDILLAQLKKFGVESVVANTHYFAQKIHDRYMKNSPVELNFSFTEEEVLSGTAGGLKKCQYYFNEGENFFVLSADGLSDVDLAAISESHTQSGAIATIILKNVERSEVFKFGVIVQDENGFVKEFQEKPSVEEAQSTLTNTGIYVFNYKIFDFIPENMFFDFAKDVFPALQKKGEKINTFIMDNYWNDIGAIRQYVQSTRDIFDKKIVIDNVDIMEKPNGRLILGNTKLDESVDIIGDCVIGDNCKIGKNAVLKDVILWDGVEIAQNIELDDCIICNNSKISVSMKREVIAENSIIDSNLVRS